jgi:hypothetical protein
VITEPTVLILGAGASYPYGFPTASELKGLICDAFSNPDTFGSRLLGDNSDYNRDQIFDFRQAFWRAGQPSIDSFLEYRKDLLGIGKLAIAYCLVPFEDEKSLYMPVPQHLGGHWYEYLSVKLTADFDHFSDNKLSIITFNYDRSLEHYLFLALQNLHRKSAEECAKKLAEIPIIHVYGQLGKEPYPQPKSRDYDPDNTRFIHVARAAAGITLLHEEAGDLEIARKFLNDAAKICFLGFSYHPLNLKRLQLENSSGRRVFGTVRGLLGKEVQQTQEALHNRLLTGNVLIQDEENLALLRKHLILG